MIRTHLRPMATLAVISVVLLGLAAGTVSAAGATTVTLSPDTSSITPTETTTVDVVVDRADGGVGAYALAVTLEESSVGTITAVELHGEPGLTNRSTGPHNDSVRMMAALANTSDSGTVTVATVTVRGESAGRSTLSVDVEALGDERGNSYGVETVRNATLVVEQPSSTPASNQPDAARDLTDPPGDTEQPLVEWPVLAAGGILLVLGLVAVLVSRRW